VASLADKFSASEISSLNKFTGVGIELGGVKDQITQLASTMSTLQANLTANLQTKFSEVDAKLASLTSQTQNSNSMFPNQGTGKGGSRGLVDKMMIPEICSDETNAPLTPWSDKMEAFLEDKHRGFRRVMTLCRKTKVGDIPGDITSDHISGMVTEVPWEMAQQLYDFILNRSTGECYKVVKAVRDANGVEA
jgi:hypothetical protein